MLLLSGYWPVVGTAVAVVTRDGAVALAAPEDEADLAASGWAEPVHLFQPGSVQDLFPTAAAVRDALRDCLHEIGLTRGRIGWEAASVFAPAPYAAFHVYGATLAQLCRELVPAGTLVPADETWYRLRAVPTAMERASIRRACGIAGRAFDSLERPRAGMTEAEVAAALRSGLLLEGRAADSIERADGFAWCMSGPHSARAFASHARTRHRRLVPGDLVLVHCNSYADGFWTDITRTYTVGPPSDRQQELYDAVFAARRAALDAIRPGAHAARVDRAAREVLEARGLGEAFKHPTGHGVGFAAMDHHARPRLHPASPDLLESGMVFNVEPAVYFTGEGGLRHCDMVEVTDSGADVLTPFGSRAAGPTELPGS